MLKSVARASLCLFLFVAVACAAQTGATAALRLMPKPAKLSVSPGRMAIDQNFRVKLSGYTEPRLVNAAARLVDRLSRKTGIHMMAINAAMPGSAVPGAAGLEVRCEHASAPVQKFSEDESYRLEVTESGARLSAATPLGVLHGLQTFSQLVTLDREGFMAPLVQIEDQPRFPWRGLMLDSSRHFHPVEVVKRVIDGMEVLKLNTFHWHLSDDQGFRVECKTFPKLHEMGSDGQYYTQDQIRDVIAYAREHGIRVMPEFDMPGHTTSWFVGYPELRTAAGPTKIEDTWGIMDACMDVSKEQLYTFLDRFVAEMAALFPDEYFHIGGDEVNGKEWSASPAIAAFKQSRGIKSNEEVQGYFNQRLQAIVNKHGKKVIGWDEIFSPGLPKNIVVHSWRGPKALAEAARQGYQGILSNGYYLDLMYPASDHYRVDPTGGAAAALTDEQKKLILGGEACEWSEFAVPENVEDRIFPRLAAVAERLWSPADLKDLDSMYGRMAQVDQELEWAGVRNRINQAIMYKRLIGDASIDPQPLKTLGSIIEPVKEYHRPGSRKYVRQTPLNRLIDAIDPESTTGRAFNADAKQLEKKALLRAQLTRWRDNDQKLKPILENSALLRENLALSESVFKIAGIGLECLDYIDSGRAPAADWVKQQQAFLDAFAKPKRQDELIIIIVPGVRSLLNAAAGRAQTASAAAAGR